MSRSLKNQLAERNIIRQLIIKSNLDSSDMVMDMIAKRYDKWYGHYMGLEILWEAIADEVNPKIKDSCIDVGCGTGAILGHIHKNRPDIRLVGVDISIKSLEIAKNMMNNNGTKTDNNGTNDNVSFRQSLPTKIPLEDESFSNGISTFSFSLWSHHVDMLNEIFRIMKTGEEFIIFDINGDEKYEEDILNDMRRMLKTQNTPYFIRKLIEIDIDCIVKVLGLFSKKEIEDIIKSSMFKKYEIKERPILHSSEHMFLEVSLIK